MRMRPMCHRHDGHPCALLGTAEVGAGCQVAGPDHGGRTGLARWGFAGVRAGGSVVGRWREAPSRGVPVTVPRLNALPLCSWNCADT
jgi:hypothetical protein